MNFIRQTISKIKDSIQTRFTKDLDKKTIETYKSELSKFLDDIQLLGESDIVDELVAELGIAGTAKEYQNLNYVFKAYYMHMIKEINKSANAKKELKDLANKTAEEWEGTLKGVISHLYKKRQKLMYGESLEPDYFSGVKIYHANSFADEQLPWLKKEDINEIDHFDEGLTGAVIGGISGSILALVLSSLAATFKMNPKFITGISTALGIIIGHFVQKHYFIDFTNYVKLKRYVEYEPESYEFIIEMMQKNATKFKDKDPVKYKKIIQNLKRLQKNAPPEYRTYLDDEIEAEDAYDDDRDLFDIYDPEGRLVKRGTSELEFKGSRSDRGYTRRLRVLGRSSDYDVRDLGDSDLTTAELEELMMQGL